MMPSVSRVNHAPAQQNRARVVRHPGKQQATSKVLCATEAAMNGSLGVLLVLLGVAYAAVDTGITSRSVCTVSGDPHWLALPFSHVLLRKALCEPSRFVMSTGKRSMV